MAANSKSLSAPNNQTVFGSRNDRLLNKMHKTRELEDTPSVRGMIRKVAHLVKVDETPGNGG